MILQKVSKSITLLLIAILGHTASLLAQEEKVMAEIKETGRLIREAFSNSDIETIRSFHHPEVVKALSYDIHLIGRTAVIENLKSTLNNHKLEFIRNEIEHILIDGNLAIEQTQFTIKGTPKDDGESWIFKGRTMVTYKRYHESPTGWATIREVIQVATN